MVNINLLTRKGLGLVHSHSIRSAYTTQVDYPGPVLTSSVIISNHDNIYRNLALEDWLYTSYPRWKGDSSSWYHLLLWTNRPCIVIGRHQNPWNEVHINRCHSLGLPIARRNSGGGTVVHDLGNLNLCFLSDKKSYNRRRNNQFIIDTLSKYYGIKCAISDRENLVTCHGGFKVSGTASKLSSMSTYHHCTLMVNVDLSLMAQVTKLGDRLFKNKATPSVHASVENLSSLCPSLNMNNLITNLADEFTRRFGDQGVIHVEPTEEIFPSIGEITDKLKEWKWIFGKTPTFEINGQEDKLICKLTITHGLIQQIETVPSMDFKSLHGLRFVKEDVVTKLICDPIQSSPDYQATKRLIIQMIDQVYL